MGIVKRFQGNMECPYAKLLATFTIHTCILSHDEMINKFDQALSALPHDTSMVEEVMHKCNLQLENDQEFSIPAFEDGLVCRTGNHSRVSTASPKNKQRYSNQRFHNTERLQLEFILNYNQYVWIMHVFFYERDDL